MVKNWLSFSIRGSFILLLSLFQWGCASPPELQGLAKNELGKNQYFDRLNEFANFGNDPDYFHLLGYNFEDAEGLLMSTTAFDFGSVPTNFSKTRKFTVINPFEKQVSAFKVSLEGSAVFKVSKSTCGDILKGHQVCTLTIKFHPKRPSPDQSIVGRHLATLSITSSVGPGLTKALAGSATP